MSTLNIFLLGRTKSFLRKMFQSAFWSPRFVQATPEGERTWILKSMGIGVKLAEIAQFQWNLRPKPVKHLKTGPILQSMHSLLQTARMFSASSEQLGLTSSVQSNGIPQYT